MADYSTCDRCGEKDPKLVPAGKQMICRTCAEERELSAAESSVAVTKALARVRRELKL